VAFVDTWLQFECVYTVAMVRFESERGRWLLRHGPSQHQSALAV